MTFSELETVTLCVVPVGGLALGWFLGRVILNMKIIFKINSQRHRGCVELLSSKSGVTFRLVGLCDSAGGQ